ncbi:ABC transporter substrate-binding protein [Oceanibaculum pacificum]|nr:ABC transporter substrate-binding protein [Oceanibaculum pacificum]
MRKLFLTAALSVALMGGAAPTVLAQNSLVATINANPNNLWPAKATIGEEYNIAVLVYNGLVRITPDLKFEPDLAESWESNEDATVWTFKLRKGVKFHHGKEFKAEDVIKTFELIGSKEVASRAKSHTDLIAKMEAPDDYTVRFTLTEPYGGWAELMIERQLKMVPSDRTLEQLTNEPIGTGPFKFVSYQPGDKVVLEKNPDYFEKGLPKLDRITLRIMPEDAVKIAALQAGDVDLVWNLPLEAIEQFKDTKGITVDQKPTATWDGFVLNNSIPPFNDMRVRQAVYKAIDKRQLVEFAVFGHGAPTHSPIPPTHPFFNKDISFEPDIAGAKKLLAEAGYPKGFKITIHAPAGRPTRERSAVALQQMLKNVGIDAQVERIPYNRWGATISGKVPFYMDGYFARPTLDTSTYPWFHSQGSWNTRMWHYKSERMDAILDKARGTVDPEEQKKLYTEFQKVVVEEVPGVVMYSQNFVTAYKDKLKGYTTHPYLWMDLRTAHFE